MKADSESLVAQYSKLIWFYAHKYANAYTPAEDLYTEGCIGLLHARDNYKPEQGHFANYAKIRISGAMLDSLRSKGSIIRKGRTASGMDIANIDDYEYLPTTADMSTSVINSMVIDMATKALSARESEVIDGLYVQELSNSELSQNMKLSTCSISVIKHRAIDKMREALA